MREVNIHFELTLLDCRWTASQYFSAENLFLNFNLKTFRRREVPFGLKVKIIRYLPMSMSKMMSTTVLTSLPRYLEFSKKKYLATVSEVRMKPTFVH